MTKTFRLNDLQLVLLSNAAARDNGSLVPLPDSCAGDTGRISKAVASLLRRKLVEEIPVTDRNLAWREENQDPIGLFITDAGRSAIGVDDEQEGQEDAASAKESETAPNAADGSGSASSTSTRPGSKIATIVAMLEREQGATLDALVEATGWLPHTTRAALTGLRKKGHTVTSEKVDDVRNYRIAAGN